MVLGFWRENVVSSAGRSVCGKESMQEYKVLYGVSANIVSKSNSSIDNMPRGWQSLWRWANKANNRGLSKKSGGGVRRALKSVMPHFFFWNIVRLSAMSFRDVRVLVLVYLIHR